MDIFEARKTPGHNSHAHYRSGRSGIFGLQSERQVAAWEVFHRGMQDFLTRTALVEVEIPEMADAPTQLVEHLAPEAQEAHDYPLPLGEAA